MLPCSNLRRWVRAVDFTRRTVAIALVTTLLAIAAAQPNGDDPYAPDFVETSRIVWGATNVVFEENQNAESVAFFPFLASRHRILDEDGLELAVVDGVDPSSVVLVDLDGDGHQELVMTGNSGGATGCCDLIEVWTLVDGTPTPAFHFDGGRGSGDGFGLLDRRSDGRVPVRAWQYLYVGDVPFCCLPGIPRAFTWNGRFVEDATRSEQMDALVAERDRYRHEVRSRSSGASDDFMLDAAAIGAYAVAAVMGDDAVEDELDRLRSELPTDAFDRLEAVIPQIHRAVEAWVFELNR